MLIKYLNEMEDIVSNSDSLRWDGWNVINLIEDDLAEYTVEGYFDRKNSRWYRKNTYFITENGWEIPESVM